MTLRSTVKPYEKSPADGSEDRHGAPPSAGKPSPSPNAAAWAAAPIVATPDRDGPLMVSQRLAVNVAGLDADSLELKVDGDPVPVPPTGFVEFQLAVDAPHRLQAAAKRNGQPVAWSQVVVPHINSEAEPLEAALA
jgi:hypothetical protein